MNIMPLINGCNKYCISERAPFNCMCKSNYRISRFNQMMKDNLFGGNYYSCMEAAVGGYQWLLVGAVGVF